MPLILLGAILTATLLTYAPHWSAGFVYDDHGVLERMSAVGRSAGFAARPLTRMLWWSEAHIWPSATGYHVVSLALHGVCIALVWLLLARLGLSPLAVALGTAFFALNATAVETVAYMSAQGELLAAVGVLGACVLVAGDPEWSGLLWVMLAWLLAMSGKESAIVGLALMPLVARKWSAALVAIGVCCVAVAWFAMSHAMAPTWDWAMVQGAAALRLLVISIIPWAHPVDYDYTMIRPFWIAMTLAFSDLMLCAWLLRERYPRVAMGLLWVGIVVAPRLFIHTQGSILNDHQFYLALVGVSIFMASLVPSKELA